MKEKLKIWWALTRASVYATNKLVFQGIQVEVKTHKALEKVQIVYTKLNGAFDKYFYIRK